MHAGCAPSVAFSGFLDIFRQKGTFFPAYLYVLNDAREDANLLILNIQPILAVVLEVLDSSVTLETALELFGSVSPVVGVKLHKLEAAERLLVAAECLHSAAVVEFWREQSYYLKEKILFQLFFFMLLEKCAINSGKRKLSFMVQNSCACFVPKHF